MPYLVRLPLALLGLTAFSLLVSPLHLVTARTARGRAWGLAHLSFLLMAAGGLPFVAALVWRRQTGAVPFDPTPWAAVELAGLAGLLVTSAFVLRLGRGDRTAHPPGSRLASVGFWLWATNWRYEGYTGPLLPETDLVRLGVALVTRLDPLMTRAEARTVRAVLRPLLAGMDADPAYDRLIPAYQWAAVSLARRRPERFHLFAHAPHDCPRPGLLVFLHGHGPNLALYLHVWRDFADRHGLAVVCPTFGYGNWDHPDGVEAVRWALDQAGDGYDPSRVYLAGISQGGAGVGRAAVAMPDRFAGLVLLSPTVEPAVIAELAAVWRKPVYVAQGGRDHNVRPGPVTAAVEALRAGGADVTYHFDAAADHFLFFAERQAIQAELGDWLQRVG